MPRTNKPVSRTAHRNIRDNPPGRRFTLRQDGSTQPPRQPPDLGGTSSTPRCRRARGSTQKPDSVKASLHLHAGLRQHRGRVHVLPWGHSRSDLNKPHPFAPALPCQQATESCSATHQRPTATSADSASSPAHSATRHTPDATAWLSRSSPYDLHRAEAFATRRC